MMKELTRSEEQGQYPVILYQHNRNSFSVTYGNQHNVDLDRQQAATEYGQCVMHQLSCAGKLLGD